MTTRGFFFFPGQGAQVIGMARDVVEAGGLAKALFEEASEILEFDLAELVFSGEIETLSRTENCQPALLVASIALLETLRERTSLTLTGAAGLSLGEYTALVALHALDFADAVRLVRQRGELMEAAARGKDTGMSTILDLSAAAVDEVCQAAASEGVVVPANYNCPGQIVISGEKAALAKAGELAKAAGAKRVIPLKVSGAFHSPIMEAARAGLVEALAEVSIRVPDGRFVNNADARELSEPEDIRDALARQVVSPVRWEQSCRHLLDLGETHFYEVGPGRTCKGLMKRIDRGSPVTVINTLRDITDLLKNAGE